MFTPSLPLTTQDTAFATILQELKYKINRLGDYTLTDRYQSILDTYTHMVTYMLNGYDDPSMPTMHQSLIEQINILTSHVDLQLYATAHRHEQFSAAYLRSRQSPSLATLVDKLEHLSTDISDTHANTILTPEEKRSRLTTLHSLRDTTTASLFDLTWTTSLWSRDERDQATRLILSDTISAEEKCVFISAATLSALTFFNQDKLPFLLDAYLINDPILSPRALVGYVLSYLVLSKTGCDTTDLEAAIRLHQDDNTYITDIYTCITCLTMSLQTKEISQKIEGELMPLLLNRHNPDKNLQENITRFIEEGGNPEWIDQAKADKKIQQFAALQQDGADLNYNTFKTFKNTHFFMQPHRWFYPFSVDILKAVERDLGTITDHPITHFILSSSTYSDSDKYSFCYLFRNIDRRTLELINSWVDIDPEFLNTAKERNLLSSSPLAAYRNYIADLFRFLTLSPCRNEIENPIASDYILDIDPLTISQLLDADFLKAEQVESFADFLMRQHHFDQASQLFSLLPQEFDIQDPAFQTSIYQKSGYCKEKNGNLKAAIHDYNKADTLKPNSKWTLKRLASTAIESHTPELAILALRQLLDMEPDNIRYMTEYARQCLLLQRYDDALRSISKANYISPTPDTQALQLQCELILGHLDTAAKLLRQLSADTQPTEQIRILATAYHYIAGHIRQAHQAFGTTDDPQAASEVRQLILQHQYLLTKTGETPQLNLFIQSLGMDI